MREGRKKMGQACLFKLPACLPACCVSVSQLAQRRHAHGVSCSCCNGNVCCCCPAAVCSFHSCWALFPAVCLSVSSCFPSQAVCCCLSALFPCLPVCRSCLSFSMSHHRCLHSLSTFLHHLPAMLPACPVPACLPAPMITKK